MVSMSVLTFYSVRASPILLEIFAHLRLVFDRYTLIPPRFLNFWLPFVQLMLLNLSLIVSRTLEIALLIL